MLKIVICLLLASQAVLAQKLSMDQRRRGILGIIEEELSEVSRLARQQNYGSPDTLLRMSELNLEKARLWRETENEKYLSIPPEERRNTKKSSFFANSTKFYQAANSSASVVIKKFPKYKNIGEVYYILAFNMKELGNHKEAKKYFSLTTKNVSSNSEIAAKSKLSLADYYYNDHEYSKAVPLYETSINKVDERWWTKDSFNLAWAYYRTRKYDQAISMMKEVHRRSADEKYIDMRAMVERDIGVFYVDAGRMKDAVSFYEGLGLNYTEQFVKIASAITSQGRFSQSESLLDQAAKFEKDRERKIEILLAQLDLFDKYNKISNHLKTCQELVAFHQQDPINGDQYKKLVFHVDRKAAQLQKATASKLYENVPKSKSQKSNDAIKYFELSSILSPGQKSEKVFFQAETAYAANNYSKALGFYLNSFDGAKDKGDKKVMTQSLEGMLSSLGQKGLSSKVADKYYVPVYSRYLSVDSNSSRANTIFVKLFNTQFGSGQISDAEATMKKFADNFPSDFKTQEGMLAKIMEHYRKKKDYGKVKGYVAAINSGDFKVSKKYADALRSLMTKIQIEGVQQSLDKGDKAIALKGYHQIYESSESTIQAKTNASYNLAALYFEAGDIPTSYKWSTIAVREMSVSDVNKFADSYLSIAAGMFLKQYFEPSADLSHRVLAKLCKQNSSNKPIAYKNSVFIALANSDLDKALEIRDFGKNCLVPDKNIAEVSIELLKELSKEKRWEAYEKIVEELELNAKNYPILIKPLEDLRIQFSQMNDKQAADGVESKQWKYYKQSKQQQLDIPVEGLDIIAGKMLKGIQAKKDRIEQIQLAFPESNFNNAVKSKLQLLDGLTAEVNEVQKVGSGIGIVDAYNLVINAYENFGNALKEFSPEGKGPEYVASFKKAMSDVYAPILSNAAKQRSEIKKLIIKNKILAASNFDVLSTPPENYKRYITLKDSVLMDRGGRR